jgi:D-alanyl-lipoteichoic acid acyltransferase DltB (MBOAT superfamily)
MSETKNSIPDRRAQTGTALLTVGSALMFAKLSFIAVGLPQFLATLGIDALGAPAAAGLAVLRFFRAIVFHPAALLPVVCAILVLSFAMVSILSGLVLLRDRRRHVENAQ